MKWVWLLLWEDYEATFIKGVYSSEEAAKKARSNFAKKERLSVIDYEIISYEVED